MPNPVSISEKMLYCTVPIKLIENNQTVNTASSFFFNYETTNNKQVIILIANRHFVENVDDINQLDFSLNKKKIEIEITNHFDDDTNGMSRHLVDWYLHPTEDLAFCFWNPILSRINRSTNKNVFLLTLDESTIPTQQQLDDLSALENVVMIGYPNGMYDMKNNLPLFRNGSTSSHPAFDFNGKKHALVDMACIPGSSGSPVFILNEGLYSTKNGSTVIGNRLFFLGIENMSPIQSSPVYEKVMVSGKSVIQKSQTMYVKNFINLGYYIKSSEMSALKTIVQSLLPPSDILK